MTTNYYAHYNFLPIDTRHEDDPGARPSSKNVTFICPTTRQRCSMRNRGTTRMRSKSPLSPSLNTNAEKKTQKTDYKGIRLCQQREPPTLPLKGINKNLPYLTLTLGTILNKRNVIKMLIICVRFLKEFSDNFSWL